MNIKFNRSILLSGILLALPNSSLFAVTSSGHPFVQTELKGSNTPLNSLIPATDESIRFQITSGTSENLITSFKKSLDNFFRNPYITFKDNQDSKSSLSLTSGNSHKGKVFAGLHPLCDVEVAASQAWDGFKAYFGSVPYIRPDALPIEDNFWPLFSDTLYPVRDKFLTTPTSKLSIQSYSKCYMVEDGSLYPAFQIRLQTDKSSYAVFADDSKVFDFYSTDLHVNRNAKAVAYDVNKNNAEVEHDIVVDDSGYLKNADFETYTNGVAPKVVSVPEVRGSETVHVFQSSNQYQKGEINVFTHVSKALNYFKSLGFVNDAGVMDLDLNITINGSTNNAIYKPSVSTNTGRPYIAISTGDGTVLQNLSFDSDVVSHEYGHHTLWRSLQTTYGETLILHEGLADFFTFAYQGDSCLGESVCPANSTFCWYQGQCLRSADNSITYKDPTYSSIDPHLQGQLVSGLLWDFFDKQGISLTTVAQMTFEAVNYLSSNSGLVDLALALSLADRNLNGGVNLCKIKAALEDRGFSPYISMTSCDPSSSWSSINQTTTVSSGTGYTASSSQDEDDDKDEGLFGLCSLNSSGHKKEASGISILILIISLLSPIALTTFGRGTTNSNR